MADLTQLRDQLRAQPDNWELRAEVVEALALLGDDKTARELMRTSPDGPVPYHLQKRFWHALAPFAGIDVKTTEEGRKPLLTAKAKSFAPKPQRRAKTHPALCLPDATSPRRITLPEAPVTESSARSLQLETLAPERNAAPSPASEQPLSRHVSSLSLALLFHLVLAVLLSAVALRSYTYQPAAITVIAPPAEDEADLEKRKIVRKVDVSQPAAPSKAGMAVMNSSAAAPVVIPSFRNLEPSTDFNLVDTGLGISSGLSFEGVGVESAVNFFGIESGGRNIAFLIEADPHMLVDEKGGMFAYDKVKREIGAMLTSLDRGTAFNIILFEGKKLQFFRDKPVRALPSTIAKAIAWLEPLNRDYEQLGLGSRATTGGVRPGEVIPAQDVSHYTKAIQAAIEQNANAIFCITSGWRNMGRSLSPEDQAKLDEAREKQRQEREGMDLPAAEYDPREVERWRRAQEKARTWLQNENAARAEKGLPPKVVLDFGALIRKLSPNASPPRRTNPLPDLPPLGVDIERGPPYAPEEVESHLQARVNARHGPDRVDHPSLNLVIFLGEDEALAENPATRDHEDHFKRLVRENRGQLKVLKGLAALEDVTSTR